MLRLLLIKIERVERAEINISLLTIFKITNVLESSFTDFFKELKKLQTKKREALQLLSFDF